ncbi:MAG: hypothetical protein Q9165_005164 [Trypethelium subeluteriae]
MRFDESMGQKLTSVNITVVLMKTLVGIVWLTFLDNFVRHLQGAKKRERHMPELLDDKEALEAFKRNCEVTTKGDAEVEDDTEIQNAAAVPFPSAPDHSSSASGPSFSALGSSSSGAGPSSSAPRPPSFEAGTLPSAPGLVDPFASMMTLDGGLQNFDEGLHNFDGGLHNFDGGLADLDGGMANFKGGLGDFDGGLGNLDGGLDDLNGGLDSLNGGLGNLDLGLNTFEPALDNIDELFGIQGMPNTSLAPSDLTGMPNTFQAAPQKSAANSFDYQGVPQSNPATSLEQQLGPQDILDNSAQFPDLALDPFAPQDGTFGSLANPGGPQWDFGNSGQFQYPTEPIDLALGSFVPQDGIFMPPANPGAPQRDFGGSLGVQNLSEPLGSNLGSFAPQGGNFMPPTNPGGHQWNFGGSFEPPFSLENNQVAPQSVAGNFSEPQNGTQALLADSGAHQGNPESSSAPQVILENPSDHDWFVNLKFSPLGFVDGQG